MSSASSSVSLSASTQGPRYLGFLGVALLGMKNDPVKGHIDLLVLAVLADAPQHGYAVIERLRQRSAGAFDLPEGTVYPVLHRLEESGLVSSEWSQPAGRRRRSYTLTAAGHRALADQQASWSEFVSAMSTTLRGVPWPTTP